MSTIDVTAPYDGKLIKTINTHTAQNAEKMLQTAEQTYKDKTNWLHPHQRTTILTKLADLVTKEQNNFAKLIAQEGGKPLTDAKIEVTRAIDGIHLAIKELPRIMNGKEIPMGQTQASENRTAHTTYEPIGIVIAISTFNHPLNLIIHQIIPAIAVGCPVIVKPATATPLNCLKLINLIHKAGLPKNWCQVCICDTKTAQKLATDKRINFLTFIGSAKIGWMLKNKLAPGVRCALEHGGVAPVIVDQTADLTKTIPSLLKGAYYHAGQVCVSIQRIYVHKTIIKELTNKLTKGASKLKIGDPTKQTTEIGPIIHPKETDRIHDWVTEAIKGGAKLLTGGKKISPTTYAPTLLLNPPQKAKISTQEIFGPVACIYEYDNIDQAIEKANSLPYAFQAAIYTNDLNTANHATKHLNASTVMINDHTAFRVDWMPFAGRNHSGYGIGGIGYTMHDMTQHKLTITKHD